MGNEYSFRNTRHECEYRSRGATSTRVLAGPYMDPMLRAMYHVQRIFGSFDYGFIDLSLGVTSTATLVCHSSAINDLILSSI